MPVVKLPAIPIPRLMLIGLLLACKASAVKVTVSAVVAYRAKSFNLKVAPNPPNIRPASLSPTIPMSYRAEIVPDLVSVLSLTARDDEREKGDPVGARLRSDCTDTLTSGELILFETAIESVAAAPLLSAANASISVVSNTRHVSLLLVPLVGAFDKEEV